uniref:Regulator of G-protein signaling 13 n=2 Tax=Iconisemion striatum TaxID=60296 RepID=A0A1A7WY21_9TELE
MPILVTSPALDLQLFNMDAEDRKTGTCMTGNLKSLLQHKIVQAANTGRLCREEMTQWSLSLDRLLSSKYGMKIFQAFLKSEFSDENLEFWSVCEDFKKISCPLKMSFKAKKIFKVYIRTEAPREINIDHKTRELVRSNMKALSTVCFDDAQKIVYRLMEKDSYPRFLRSNVYRTLLDSTRPSMT